MKNPWLSKNPFTSMWLSGANSVLGAARSHVAAAAHRQTAAMVSEGTRQMIAFWTGAPATRPRRKKKGR